jgi:hypothetical protein
MLAIDYALGSFGDVRLEKRGLSFWAEWSVIKAHVAVALPKVAGAKLLVFLGFWRTVE